MNKQVAEEIIAIFMRREDITYEDASNWLKEACFMVNAAILNEDDIEEVWMEETGLEPDYLYDLMFL